MQKSMAQLSGRSLIGSRDGAGTGAVFCAADPATGQNLEPGFTSANEQEVDAAVGLAAEAFETYSRLSGRERGVFLRQVATNIEAMAGELIERAHRETALPVPRLQSETGRTCGQLRMFAQVAEEGSWVQAR